MLQLTKMSLTRRSDMFCHSYLALTEEAFHYPPGLFMFSGLSWLCWDRSRGGSITVSKEKNRSFLVRNKSVIICKNDLKNDIWHMKSYNTLNNKSLEIRYVSRYRGYHSIYCDTEARWYIGILREHKASVFLPHVRAWAGFACICHVFLCRCFICLLRKEKNMLNIDRKEER